MGICNRFTIFNGGNLLKKSCRSINNLKVRYFWEVPSFFDLSQTLEVHKNLRGCLGVIQSILSLVFHGIQKEKAHFVVKHNNEIVAQMQRLAAQFQADKHCRATEIFRIH
jgi:hypothetical protein